MKNSPRIRKLIKQFEGLRLESYQDIAGVRTIGYGHAMPPGPKLVWTKLQAERMLDADMKLAADAVRRLVTVPLTQGEFDALTSFTFNLGQGSLAKSTLLKHVNAGKTALAAGQFSKWVNAGEKPVKGLKERRRIERSVFLNLPW